MATKNPTSPKNPRFDPKTDAANAAAHGMKSSSEPRREKARAKDIQNTVARSIERAIQHYEEHREPNQEEATRYYKGEPFGDEEEGRSKVVSTDVRDATHLQIPDLIEIFTSPERAVEYTARYPDDEAFARQATDYVNAVIQQENDGFLTLDAWFKDALVRNLGIVKWWWENGYRVKGARYSGQSEEQLQALVLAEGVEIVESTQGEDGTYDVLITRREQYGCAKFQAIPPEEFVFTPNARSLEGAPTVAHVRLVPADELRQIDIPEKLIKENLGKQRTPGEAMKDARAEGSEWDDEDDAEDVDDSQKKVLFAEAYCLVDGDGDGVAELRMFHCIGPDFTIANGEGEIVDEVPFACLTPHPEPHTLIGLGNFDLLKDVQRVKSQILRETLNSLALAVEPKTEVVEGEVNIGDLMAPEIAGVVRVRKPGMMREVSHTFVGHDTLPMLAFYNEIMESRTGHNKAAAGLDADSLQSATKAAVAATISGAARRLKYIARVFAETGVKRLYAGLLKLIIKHADGPRIYRMRGQYFEADPKYWNVGLDVSVNVGLGQGTPEDRIVALTAQLDRQMALMQAGAPFVTWEHIRATLAKLAELTGWRNPAMFYAEWGPEQQAQWQQEMSQQPPPQDPNMALVQVEAGKAAAEQQMSMLKFQLEKWKAEMEDDRERDKIVRESALKEYELELKHAAEINDAKLQAKIAADRAAMDADIKREQIRNQPAEAA